MGNEKPAVVWLVGALLIAGCGNTGEAPSAFTSSSSIPASTQQTTTPLPTMSALEVDPGVDVNPLPTADPPVPTVDISPYPAGGAFFAATPARYDRAASDVSDVLVRDKDGEPFMLTTGDRILHLDDGRALTVPAETPVHGRCAPLLTAHERELVTGQEGATIADAHRDGAALPCGVYGMVEGTTVRWLAYTELVPPGRGPGLEGLIPLREAAVDIDGDRIQLFSGRSVPRAEELTLDCRDDFDSPEAMVAYVNGYNEVYVEAGADHAVALACIYGG